MVKFGYKLMSEEHGPKALVENARRAEEAGFDFAAISDHFSPWIEEQGHAPLAWTVLGAIAGVTSHLDLMTAVTCPIMRYHPAIVAQFAATMGVLSDNRFTLGLGSGERLNEHVVGEGWPGVQERQRRLEEACEIIEALLSGGTKHYDGIYFEVDNARLYDLPDRKVPVIVAAGGPKAATLAAASADGLIATEPKRELVDAYRSAGGNGPCYAEVSVCMAASEEEARNIAHCYFRWSASGWPVQAELPDTKAFAAASQHVTPEQLATKISCGPSIEAHIEKIHKYIEAGFDHIIITQIGPDQDAITKAFADHLAPRLRATSVTGASLAV